jgi:hypothetical protein
MPLHYSTLLDELEITHLYCSYSYAPLHKTINRKTKKKTLAFLFAKGGRLRPGPIPQAQGFGYRRLPSRRLALQSVLY